MEPEEQQVPAPPPALPLSLEEFVQTHSPGRNVETLGGFAWWARQQGWAMATRDEWIERLTAFRTRGAG